MSAVTRTGAVLALVLATASCSSSHGPGEPKDDRHKSGGPGTVVDYAWDGLTIEFSPMYSAFIDADHPCAIPGSVTEPTPKVQWAASDDSMVELAPTPTGVMIATKGAGTVDIIAYTGTGTGTGDLAGRSQLYITQFTATEWEAGNARYHNGVAYDRASQLIQHHAGEKDSGTDSFVGIFPFPPPDDTACDSCHGEAAPNLPTEITPQQIGDYSDDELGQIIERGQRPVRSRMHLFPEFAFQALHTFKATDPHYQMTHNSIIAYLRSLAPKAQIARDAGATPNP